MAGAIAAGVPHGGARAAASTGHLASDVAPTGESGDVEITAGAEQAPPSEPEKRSGFWGRLGGAISDALSGVKHLVLDTPLKYVAFPPLLGFDILKATAKIISNIDIMVPFTGDDDDGDAGKRGIGG